jgi:hypothetical protein
LPRTKEGRQIHAVQRANSIEFFRSKGALFDVTDQFKLGLWPVPAKSVYQRESQQEITQPASSQYQDALWFWAQHGTSIQLVHSQCGTQSDFKEDSKTCFTCF